MARRPLSEIKAAEYQRGYDDGYSKAKIFWTKEMETRLSVRASQLELAKAVTTLVSAAGQTVQSLAQVYDTGPRT